MTKVTIDRAVLSLHRLTAGDESRPVLKRIFRNKGGFAAANGYIGASIQHDDEKYGEVPADIQIHAGIAKQIKTSAKHPRFTIDREGDVSTVSSDATPWARLVLESGPNLYTGPEVNTLLHPSSDIPLAAVSVNASFLRQMADFLKAATAGTQEVVEIRIYDRNQAVEFRSRTEQKAEIRGLLMPMVVNSTWVFDPVDDVSTPSECEQVRFRKFRENMRESDAAGEETAA